MKNFQSIWKKCLTKTIFLIYSNKFLIYFENLLVFIENVQLILKSIIYCYSFSAMSLECAICSILAFLLASAIEDPPVRLAAEGMRGEREGRSYPPRWTWTSACEWRSNWAACGAKNNKGNRENKLTTPLFQVRGRRSTGWLAAEGMREERKGTN